MITHLLLLRFLQFQRDSFVSYRFASEVTREEVVGTTAGGERVCGEFTCDVKAYNNRKT
jgi:hypothetical protein